MPPRAETLEQLERWLLAFYQELVPDKLANVPKIAKKMMHDQPGLDSKLKAAYNKGLRYAAHLAGDAQEKSKRKFDSQRGSSRADFFPTKRPPGGVQHPGGLGIVRDIGPISISNEKNSSSCSSSSVSLLKPLLTCHATCFGAGSSPLVMSSIMIPVVRRTAYEAG